MNPIIVITGKVGSKVKYTITIPRKNGKTDFSGGVAYIGEKIVIPVEEDEIVLPEVEENNE